ncbi:unnamed protein product [Meloidogyne enterolobii]|uniref:Uncharacterized protein n=1 Tax=Meloidogyne enterolobii TaxID=390850 RepID=A0ACB1ATI5_MELEN
MKDRVEVKEAMGEEDGHVNQIAKGKVTGIRTQKEARREGRGGKECGKANVEKDTVGAMRN